MAEVSLRRKRPAQEEGRDDESLFKRSRLHDASHFTWLWSPPHPSAFPSSSGLWSQPVPDGMFLTRHDLPCSFSVSLEPTHSKRPRRRGAISVTPSAAPSDVDRHLAQQLQQQIAVIRLKAAADCRSPLNADCCQEDTRDDDDTDAEVDRIRRGLESVQIDAALPSILGFSIDFDRKLRLGTSSRSSETSRHQDTGSPAGAGPAATSSSSSSTCCCPWDSGKMSFTGVPSPNLQVPHHNGHNPRQHDGSSNGGLWRRPRT